MARSHLAAFEPANSKNTILRLAAEVLGIPLNNMPPVRDTLGGNMQERSARDEINSSILSKSAPHSLRAGDVVFPRPEKTVEGYLNGFPDSGARSRLRKSYFDENSSKKRLGAQLRSPHVVYDTATNMIDKLEEGRNPAYYDEDTEQYIIDTTQKRANPRYEYLLPQEAEIKQKEWKDANYRLAKNWFPLYGVLDGRTEKDLGHKYSNTFKKTADERQKLEDRVIREAMELEYKKPDTVIGSFLNTAADAWVNYSGDETVNALQKDGGFGNLLLQKRLELEKQPLSFFKNKRRVRELMDERKLNFTDAVDELKRKAIDEYAKEYSNLSKKYSFYDKVADNLQSERVRDFYKHFKNIAIDIPIENEAEKRMKEYLYK